MARHGKAGHGRAWQGMVRGKSWLGRAWRGKAGRGLDHGVFNMEVFLMDPRVSEAKINSATDAIAAMEPGTLVTHDVLSHLLDTTPCTRRYYSMVSKLRRVLIRDHGVFLRTEQNRGYVICRPGEEPDICIGEAWKGVRRIYRAQAMAAHVRLDRMDDAARAEATVKLQRIAFVASVLNAGGAKALLSGGA